MTRPRSIRLFEAFFLGSILLSLISTAIFWPALLEQAADQAGGAIGPVALNVAAGFGIALLTIVALLLWFFVARRGSTVAKWLVVLFVAWNLYALVSGALAGAPLLTLFGGLTLASVVLQVVAAGLLFASDTRTWFGGEPEELP